MIFPGVVSNVFPLHRMCLARDYIRKPLEQKTRSHTDLISVIVMSDTARAVLQYEPMNWVLYNKVLEMRNWSALRPKGAGNYMPALELAENLLLQSGSCSLSLLFFSDGRPSDPGQDFVGTVGNLASKIGRRLSFTCIGMAENGEDFTTLNEMVTEAEEYGCIVSFGKPSLDADSLSNIISALATSLTTTKTEMTEVDTGAMKTVRMDVLRERKGTIDDQYLTDGWWFYESDCLEKFHSWSYKNNDFCSIVDRRCWHCWKDEHSTEFHCSRCEAVYYCSTACHHGAQYYGRQCIGGPKGGALHDCARTKSKLRCGSMIRRSNIDIPSFRVAVKSKIFGEGAERMVRKFRFVQDQEIEDDEYPEFIGPVMVAKESRFVSEDADYGERLNFHRSFMRTQAIAAKFAKQFNNAIDALKVHFPSPQAHDWIERFPRIEFLEPFCVNVYDEKLHSYCFLIEPMLEGEYVKFNNNMGYVKGGTQGGLDRIHNSNSGHKGNKLYGGGGRFQDEFAELEKQMNALDLQNPHAPALGTIAEGSEEEEESDDEEEEKVEGVLEKIFVGASDKDPLPKAYSSVHEEDFPQAFSHFTYDKSKRHLIVVDLQGVFELEEQTGIKTYRLTDPVIHKHRGKKKRFSSWHFGRTDRGNAGIKAFFETHKCSEVCQILGLSPQVSKQKQTPLIARNKVIPAATAGRKAKAYLIDAGRGD
jgi:hypothetical protein